MKNLIDYVKKAIVYSTTPLMLMAANPQEVKSIADHLQSNGKSIEYTLDGSRVKAQYLKIGSAGFVSFALNGIPYLVVRTESRDQKTNVNNVIDIVDKGRDGRIDDVYENGKSVELKSVELNSLLKRAEQSIFDVYVSDAKMLLIGGPREFERRMPPPL